MSFRRGRWHTPDHAAEHDDMQRDHGWRTWLAVALGCAGIGALWWWRS